MTDTQLAVRQTNLEIVRSVDDLLRLGTILVKSGLLPTSVKTPEAAAAIILKGRELHIGAMEALSSINVIQGKPITSPQLMLALARRTGELEDIQIRDDGNTCTVIVKRKGQSPLTTTFSNDDAKRMNLLNKDNWQKQDKTMRQWRAMGANLRVTFGDATSGLYLYEEMGADVDEDGNIIQGETPRKVEHAAVNEEEVAIGIHPEPPGMFEGDAPVVTVAKERIRQAIAESVDKQTGEILAEHQFGNVVLAWKKAKAITGLEKPTLDQIWAMKPAGEDYLRGLCDFEPTGEDEKMVAVEAGAWRASGHLWTRCQTRTSANSDK